MLSYVLRKIQSDILGVGGATIFEVKSVTIIPSLPYMTIHKLFSKAAVKSYVQFILKLDREVTGSILTA